MNILLDPGFELGSVWVYTGVATRVNELARSGSWSAKLVSTKGLVLETPTNTQSIVTQSVTLVPGDGYSFSIYYNAGGATSAADLILECDPGDGSFQEVGRKAAGDGEQWLQLVGSEIKAVGTAGRVRFRTPLISGGSDDQTPPVESIWYVDDTVYEVTLEVAITNTIKSAIVADLNDISIANGYSVDIGYVGVEPRRFEDISDDLPAAFILSGDYEMSPEDVSIGGRVGLATQVYGIQMVLRSSTPNQDTDDLFDDIRNVIERTTSNTIAVARVSKADITAASEILTDPQTHEEVYFREVQIEVEYEYQRGSA